MKSLLGTFKKFHSQIKQLSKIRTSTAALENKKMEEFENNPYFAKYREKLEIAKQSNPEEFEKKVKELKEQKRRYKLPLHETAQGPSDISAPKCLNDVMNVELLQMKTQEEIAELWREYHKEKDCVFAVIPAPEYNAIHEKTSQFPNFILPVPRGGGYEFFLLKWLDDVCHFTSLTTFQQMNENAATCFSLYHYPELSASKDVVLMRGFPDLKSISVHEGQLLALQLKQYYGLHSGLRFNLVRLFNNDPSSFRHIDLLCEFEGLKRDSLLKKEAVFEGTPV